MRGFKVEFEGTDNKPSRIFEAIDFRMEYEKGTDTEFPKGHIFVALTDGRELHFCTQGDGAAIQEIMRMTMLNFENSCKVDFDDKEAMKKQPSIKISSCYGIIEIKTAEMMKHEKDTMKKEDYGPRGF